MGPVNLAFTGTIAGNQISGTCKTMFGDMNAGRIAFIATVSILVHWLSPKTFFSMPIDHWFGEPRCFVGPPCGAAYWPAATFTIAPRAAPSALTTASVPRESPWRFASQLGSLYDSQVTPEASSPISYGWIDGLSRSGLYVWP
jgi:hypothetical protein